MNGIILINKPINMTSRDVVNIVSKKLSTKKVGHTGTLDPMAEGVLVLCLGTYTKLVEELTSTEKTYIAHMKLGIQTDTGDITGNILKEENACISITKIKEVFDHFPKQYFQKVPKFSAVKVNGKKLYEYAREGVDLELPSRSVKILDLKLLGVKENEIIFETRVSKGTYIRSLIEDIAYNMGTIATMTSLIRTKQGIFSIEECISLEDITEKCSLLSVQDVFDYPCYEVTEQEYFYVKNGNKLNIDANCNRIFLSYHQEIIAIYEKKDGYYKMIFKVI